ncbi:MAG: ROK family protein [Gammaproteobacteria bacterium]|nr:ROK family protein [Gammaproteobacteria bacterium]
MRLGIDLGGTKIEIIALAADGSERLRRRVATPRNDYRCTLQRIVNIVDETEKELGVQGSIGIGTPGAISPITGLLKNANSVWLNGRPFKHDLELLLGREIRVSNDANCFVLSEATDGAARAAEIAFGVIVGTGTGAGIAIRGQVLTGANAIAGEWGHNSLPWPQHDESPGPRCYCGKRGCIETFLSGPGMSADYYRISTCHLDSKDIVAAALRGDVQAEACLQGYERRMARSLAHVINILDPDVIVLGGGMSNLERLYQNVPVLWGKYVFSDRVSTRLVPARYGDSSGVRGAAWLWDDR